MSKECYSTNIISKRGPGYLSSIKYFNSNLLESTRQFIKMATKVDITVNWYLHEKN